MFGVHHRHVVCDKSGFLGLCFEGICECDEIVNPPNLPLNEFPSTTNRIRGVLLFLFLILFLFLGQRNCLAFLWIVTFVMSLLFHFIPSHHFISRWMQSRGAFCNWNLIPLDEQQKEFSQSQPQPSVKLHRVWLYTYCIHRRIFPVQNCWKLTKLFYRFFYKSKKYWPMKMFKQNYYK